MLLALAFLLGALAGIALTVLALGHAQMLIDDVRDWLRR